MSNNTSSKDDLDNTSISVANRHMSKVQYVVIGVLVFGAILFVFAGTNDSQEKAKTNSAEVTYNTGGTPDIRVAKADENNLQRPAGDNEVDNKIPQAAPKDAPKVVPDNKAVLEAAAEEARIDAERLRSPKVVYAQDTPNPLAAAMPTKEEILAKLHAQGNINKNDAFLKSEASKGVDTAQAKRLRNLQNWILQGTIIQGVLETPITTQLPGAVRAKTSVDVYAQHGDIVLLPRGSLLYGKVNAATEQGQSRIFVVWTRIVTPSGNDIAINSAGTDKLGRIGLSGKVNNHYFKRFGNSILLSIIGGAASTRGVDPAAFANSMATYRSQITSGFQATAAEELTRNANIAPTITKNQGDEIAIMANQDLYIQPSLVEAENDK